MSNKHVTRHMKICYAGSAAALLDAMAGGSWKYVKVFDAKHTRMTRVQRRATNKSRKEQIA